MCVCVFCYLDGFVVGFIFFFWILFLIVGMVRKVVMGECILVCLLFFGVLMGYKCGNMFVKGVSVVGNFFFLSGFG